MFTIIYPQKTLTENLLPIWSVIWVTLFFPKLNVHPKQLPMRAILSKDDIRQGHYFIF